MHLRNEKHALTKESIESFILTMTTAACGKVSILYDVGFVPNVLEVEI